MSKKAILVVSFGTSFPKTREKTIGAIEGQIAQAFPDWRIGRAFTSQMVIQSIRKKEGLAVDNVPEALQRLAAEGVEEVVLQPTHLMPGKEYEKMLAQAESFRTQFRRLRFGEPLLSGEEDLRRAALALAGMFQQEEESAVVLMGHGTDAESDRVYGRLQQLLRENGCGHIYIGTVEGSLSLEDVLLQMQSAGLRRLLLTPLMIVAGDHAVNDMAGDGADSWKSRLEAAGYEVSPLLKGLGEYPQIRELYVMHVQQACAPCVA